MSKELIELFKDSLKKAISYNHELEVDEVEKQITVWVFNVPKDEITLIENTIDNIEMETFKHVEYFVMSTVYDIEETKAHYPNRI